MQFDDGVIMEAAHGDSGGDGETTVMAVDIPLTNVRSMPAVAIEDASGDTLSLWLQGGRDHSLIQGDV